MSTVSDNDPLIGYAEMGRRAGIRPGTLSGYLQAGRLPRPDDVSVSDRPRWRLSTFERWMAARPGPGRRFPDTSDDPLLSITEMAALAKMHRQSIYTLRSKGEFPAPDDTAVRTRPRWRKSTFDRWMADRLKSGVRMTPRCKQALGRTEIGDQEDDQSDPSRRP
ncbi:helix-turn-helix transcriptional regulator [Candidatus Frankia alpina]|uniref:Helix-turn-helix domain-containing protein n=1 Tax=Candidatus Frankia alpina TaxID=2699483 RepID=A0A4S5EPD6_9ACTN|nr:helix-turn-helix domain-containing protein [Candidatus Frankia alpina]